MLEKLKSKINFGASITFRLLKTEIKLHWSFFLLLALYTLPSVFTGEFHKALTSLIVLTTLFTLVLIHEFGHTFAARYFGFEVDKIYLHYFGGLANMTAQWKTPKQQLIIAIAGPATNVILAIVGALLTDFEYKPENLTENYWLFFTVVNTVMVLFNLLPLSPMDGGHVLTAIIWNFTKSGAIAKYYASIVTLAMMIIVIPAFIYMESYLTVVIMLIIIAANLTQYKKSRNLIKYMAGIKKRISEMPNVSNVKVRHIHIGDLNHILATYIDTTTNETKTVTFQKKNTDE